MLLAKRVTGEEEVPVGVVGLLSGDAPDVLSHLSVRARNMKVLFAACHEPNVLADVDRLAGELRAWVFLLMCVRRGEVRAGVRALGDGGRGSARSVLLHGCVLRWDGRGRHCATCLHPHTPTYTNPYPLTPHKSRLHQHISPHAPCPAGKTVAFEATSSGGVKYEEVDPSQAHAAARNDNGAGRMQLKVKIPRCVFGGGGGKRCSVM